MGGPGLPPRLLARDTAALLVPPAVQDHGLGFARPCHSASQPGPGASRPAGEGAAGAGAEAEAGGDRGPGNTLCWSKEET